MAGLQLIWPMVSRFMVIKMVVQPKRAAAMAASIPACPAPMTITSAFSVTFIVAILGKAMPAYKRFSKNNLLLAWGLYTESEMRMKDA
jgi:hypothetical protein